jgi:hypothetical protein
VNEWGWGITDGDAWDDSCRVIKVMENVGTRTAPGEVAWLKLGGSYPRCGGTAHRDAVVWVGPVVGNEAQGRPVATYRLNGISVTAKIRPVVQPLSGPGTGQPLPQPVVRPPSGATAPRFDPLPALPLPAPGVAPKPRPPQTLPSTEPSPVPVAPGVVAPPMVGTGTPPKALPPVPATATPTGPDGRPLPKPGPLVPTTPGDVHFPGGIPITSNPPQPTLQGIAQEVGRIENKMNKLLAPGTTDVPDWIGLAWRIWDFLSSANDQGEYSLHGLCERDADGNPIDSTRQFSWGGNLGAIGNVASRVDAIAEMLQYSKELKQPICAGSSHVAGEFVSVNFESRDKSPAGDKPLRKLLRYRDQTAAPLEAHVAHWDGFEWEAGGTMVEHRQGVWGKVQVWASTAVEGKRVIRHAAAIAGVDTEATGTRWVVSHSVSPRYGKPGLMRVRRLRNGAWMISKRVGPDGLPEYLAPVPTPPGP